MEDAARTPIRFDPLWTEVERVLGEAWRSEVVVAGGELLTDPERRNRLWRCTTSAGDADVPASVVVKQVVAEAYDPDDIDDPDTQRFLRDWAGAAFLSELTAGGVGPRFHGGSRSQGFVVLEDLGEHRSLVEPLLEGREPLAREALVRFAATLGRMHAAAYGQEARFDAIRDSLGARRPGRTPETERHESEDLIDRVDTSLAALGSPTIRVEGAARDEALAAVRAMNEPTRFRTFIHSDPCPDNVFYDPATGRLRLIDFEFSHYGHALHDALYGRIPFPTCWCCSRVVAEVMAEMERVYRAEFGRACPEILDDAVYLAEVAAVSGFWAVTSVPYLEHVLEKDDRWGIAGVRARLLTRLTNFVDVGDRAGGWTALVDLSRRILARLTQLWPDAEPLPFYAAFVPDPR